MQQSGAAPITIDVPRTREELDAVTMLRSELQSQLASVVQLRHELMSGVVDPARVKEVESRIARLQTDIQRADDAIAAGLARGLATQRHTTQVSPPPSHIADVVAQTIVVETFVVMLGIVLWRWMTRRSRKEPPRTAADQSARLEQLQSAVDVIAVEVERISEAQRYATRLLNEKLQPAIGAREAEPVSVKRSEAETVPAGERR